jgi:hypothetical protein
LSLETCRQIGTKLPDTETCGGLCDIFPKCLGPPSPQLLAAVARFRVNAINEQRSHSDRSEALTLIREALTAGLEKRDESDG